MKRRLLAALVACAVLAGCDTSGVAPTPGGSTTAPGASTAAPGAETAAPVAPTGGPGSGQPYMTPEGATAAPADAVAPDAYPSPTP